MYIIVKHFHLTTVALSILLFVLRYIWLMRNSSLLQAKWVKITPHIVDTFLLVSAIALCFMAPFNPLNHPWLWQKIILVVGYIGVGYFVLKVARSTLSKWIGFSVAIACLALAGKMAVTKHALFML
ncbi:SirB2 family protein [Aliiglaciecola sp. LCG003]|uniref:SirB2 family protein n=1 Tax=Aliiglaciecola sp. LCG003 TaxID=3053655 RepID=UPI002573F302|nr:SirB2 family protein [Aliiglaciecola sp. LCG003]WJG08247.1 SirB2 family protein [Aliiglaciecola sp. LCG003]